MTPESFVVKLSAPAGSTCSRHARAPSRMRDAILVAELATLLERLENPRKSTRVTLFYRYFMGQAAGAADYTAFALVLGGVLVTFGVVLYFAASIGHLLSQTLRVIMSRLMGMVLAAIAIEMIAAGLKAILPGLG